ncbi:uncharacterized protein LOC107491933 [Arachis duranensis]|uniref:Uncharacterized protein LOC107491933 n=1 Tax=Arachis duranensis TaxID=130453 RepID=A0A6P4DML4_ARADU|nr:uncharacterized protein LOC107491933 [Arachis duranensis]
MAAAEARALWQRTANRCFVQEDAKRAPKLACQSSCATSKLVDAGPANIVDESNHVVNVTHFDRKSSFSDPSAESRWWLRLQPNYGYHKDEVETMKASDESKTFSKNYEASPELMDVVAKHEALQIDSVGCSVSKQTNYSWIDDDKAEPWWRTTDTNELASFVSQKSRSHIENCDLPPPQKKHFRGHAYANISNHKIRTASHEWEAKFKGVSNLTYHEQGNIGSGLMHKKQGSSANEGLSYLVSHKSLSYRTNDEDVTFEGDPSKAELMEALCHSQTRAREAEEAAKKAYAEKEHIVALIFKQASQLFAYKQWFQLLQLEALYSQIKNTDQSISTLFPVSLPRKPRKRKQGDEIQSKPKCDVTTYAVAIALGLSLVGAGLLLGWTVGCMLPRL